MAKTRFPIAGRRGRGLVWLVATLLALALAGLGLEHGGGSPTPLNSVLSAHAKPPPKGGGGGGGGGNVNPPGETDQGTGANPAADDDNHTDNDCDHPGDNGGTYPNCTKGGHKPPPPAKCPKAHDDEGAENKAGTQESKTDEKAEQKQENDAHKACEMSAHHKKH